MLGLRRRTLTETTTTAAPERAAAPSLRILNVNLLHDPRPDHRMVASIALTVETPAGPQNTTAALSWETLAQIRAVLARVGRSISDLEIIEKVLLPWTVEQVEESWQASGTLPHESILYFGDAPRPAAASELLTRLGLLPA